jgi:hypothetical protein
MFVFCRLEIVCVQHYFFRLLIPKSHITPDSLSLVFCCLRWASSGFLFCMTLLGFKFHRFKCKLLSQLLSVRCSHIVCLHIVLLMSMVYLRGRLWKLHARELRAFNLVLLYLLPFLLIHPYTTHATYLLFVFLCIFLSSSCFLNYCCKYIMLCTSSERAITYYSEC